MDWLGHEAKSLRDQVARAWLTTWEPTIAQIPDWVLLPVGAALLFLLRNPA